jgi:hypothetical protein
MPKRIEYQPHTRGSEAQIKGRQLLVQLFQETPLPVEELLINLGLYTRSGAFAKVLFLDEIYRQVLSVPGDVIEFGTWWGQSLVTFLNLRAVHEPYSARKVIGFDTFAGYPKPGHRDKPSEVIKEGGYGVSDDYVAYLTRLLTYHEQENVMAHRKKFELVPGDVMQTVPKFFAERPEQIIALAFFDMALYEPTKQALTTIQDRLVKGSILAFDELNDPEYPGETEAVREVIGLRNCEFRRSKYLPDRTYAVIT